MTTIDSQVAEELKNLGNEKFKKGNFKEAVELYTQAIDKDWSTVILLNRSQAYLRMEK